MAYNYYTNPYTYPPPYQASAQQQQLPQQSAPFQIQNGGFVPIRSEQDARNYPVAPGNSVTFKDETAPYVYTKTMGFSQLDRPIFEKYKLIKEEEVEDTPLTNDSQKRIENEIKQLWSEINELKSPKKRREAISINE